MNGVYFADTYNHCVRHCSRSGIVSTLAGNGQRGYADGIGVDARFSQPRGIALRGNVAFLADFGNNCIRRLETKVEFQGAVMSKIIIVSTLAGDGARPGGHTDGQGKSGRFCQPRGVALDPYGALLVADSDNHCIRKVDTGPPFAVSTVAGGGGGTGDGFANGDRRTARFASPHAVAADIGGHIFVADTHNHSVRSIAPDDQEVDVSGAVIAGVVSTVIHRGDDERDVENRFSLDMPRDVVVDATGRLLIVDRYGARLCVVSGLAMPAAAGPGFDSEVRSESHKTQRSSARGGAVVGGRAADEGREGAGQEAMQSSASPGKRHISVAGMHMCHMQTHMWW